MADCIGVLPRHLGILGTTGGGKSTTVAGLVKRAADAGMAVILLDVEGEYVHLNEPTDQAGMPKALAERGLSPAGLKPGSMTVYHLVGRDCANPRHPRQIGYFRPNDANTWAAYWHNGYVFIADFGRGIDIVKLTGAASRHAGAAPTLTAPALPAGRALKQVMHKDDLWGWMCADPQ